MEAAILDFTHNAIQRLLLSFPCSTLVKFRTNNILAIKRAQQKTSHVSHNKFKVLLWLKCTQNVTFLEVFQVFLIIHLDAILKFHYRRIRIWSEKYRFLVKKVWKSTP